MIDRGTLVVLAGVSLLGAGAGLVGTFAVLRRRALTGDALAHATLPGICVAFLLAGERSLPVLLAGALVSGLVGVVVIAALTRWTRLKEDAAVGIVLGVFCGLGFALLRMILKSPGGGKAAGIDSYILGKTAGMVLRDVYVIGGVSLFVLAAVVLLYKEFRLIAFDPAFARVQGWPAWALDLGLMTLLALAVVTGLPAVGALLMAALLIIPAATARFWTDRLGVMLVLAAILGAVSGVAGTLVSSRYEKMPTGPVIVLAATVFFVVSLLAAPRRGLVASWLSRRAFRRRLEERYLLRALFEHTEPHLPNRPAVSLDQLLSDRSWSRGRLLRLLSDLSRDGLVEPVGPAAWALTEAGLRRAAAVTRGFRLWALCLTEYPDLAAGVVDLAAESVEEVLPPELVEELTAKLAQQSRLPLALGG
jgi:manganese/zinc/iron transport system permease protein